MIDKRNSFKGTFTAEQKHEAAKEQKKIKDFVSLIDPKHPKNIKEYENQIDSNALPATKYTKIN